MGRSASQKAAQRWSENASAPSFESFQRRKPQFDDEFGQSDGSHEAHDPTEAGTVRNFLPWHEVERKLAERRESGVAANDASWNSRRVRGCDEADSERPVSDGAVADAERRDSGIRDHSDSVDDPALSFRAYTLADLEKQGRAISIRPTRYSIVAEKPVDANSTWGALGEIAFAGGNFLHAIFGWLRASPRPKLADHLRAPWFAFASETRRALKIINWKKVAITLALGGTTLLVLLFIVLTAAELTDDLKPARASGVQTTTASVKTIGQQADTNNAQSDLAPAPIPTTAAAPATADDTIEIDDVPSPTTTPAKKGTVVAGPAQKPAVRPAPRTAKGKAPKSGDVFVP